MAVLAGVPVSAVEPEPSPQEATRPLINPTDATTANRAAIPFVIANLPVYALTQIPGHDAELRRLNGIQGDEGKLRGRSPITAAITEPSLSHGPGNPTVLGLSAVRLVALRPRLSAGLPLNGANACASKGAKRDTCTGSAYWIMQ